MFAILPLAAVALAATASVSGLVIPRKAPPKGWATGYLEDYNVYHTRYLAINCQSQHNTTFFDQCCHPLLATEKLEKARPVQCVPSTAAASSASAAEPTSTISTPDDGDDDDDDCDDSDDDDSTSEVTTTAHTHTSTAAEATATVKSSDEDDDDEDCDDSDDDDGKAEVTTSTHTTAKMSTTAKATTTHKATTTSTHAAATTEASTSSDNSGSSQVFDTGFATWFTQDGNAGACGIKHSDNDMIAAIDERRYGNPGKKSSLCGRKVAITNILNGKSVTVTIQDDCPGCKNLDSIDLSTGAFQKIATLAEGMVKIKWHFVD